MGTKKKIVRLTEGDLKRIVEKVLEEQKLPLIKLPMHPNSDMQAFVKVENGKKYVYFESEMNPGKTKKYGPVVANHLKDGEKFMASTKNGKLFGKGKEIILAK